VNVYERVCVCACERVCVCECVCVCMCVCEKLYVCVSVCESSAVGQALGEESEGNDEQHPSEKGGETRLCNDRICEDS